MDRNSYLVYIPAQPQKQFITKDTFTQEPPLQSYDKCVLCVSACITAHLHATLTFIHFILLRLHIQLSSFGSPPTSKRRLPCMPNCDCVNDIAAWPHLPPGLSGPLGASLCQCCMMNNSPCYHCNYGIGHSRTRPHPLNIPTTTIIPT